MKRLTTFLIASFLMLIPMAVFGQDFQKGAKAYRSGEYATALREWLALAQQGHAQTQYYLGIMYWNGQGASKDDLMAYMWWDLAAAQGYQAAVQWKANAAERLTQQQLENAQRLASTCKENNYKGCGQGSLGVRVTMNERGFLWIASLIDGDTPAARAGIKAGDFITQVDGGEVLGLSLSEAVDRIRGPVGTDIQLTIWRKDAGFQKLSVTRGITPPKSVASTSSSQNPDRSTPSASGAFNPVHLAKLKATGSCLKCNLAGADLRNMSIKNLEGANLSGANLSGAALSYIKMKLANLSGADLRGANLDQAYLSETNLSGADLRGANLYSTDLRGANLRGANMSGTDLRWSKLDGASLVDTNLTGSKLGDTSFKSTNAERANFSKAVSSGNGDNEFAFANLRDANFSGANLDRTSFSCDSRLWGKSWDKTGRRYVCRENAIGTILVLDEDLEDGIDIRSSGADLSGANFSGAVIHNVNFSFANLSKANFKGAKINPFDFDFVPFSLDATKWIQANLSGADLRKADLTNGDMTGANLSGADLRDTRLQGIKLDGAILCKTKLPWGEENGGC